jgi:hypothetical protein
VGPVQSATATADVLAADVLADVIPLPTARGVDVTDPTTTTPAPGTVTALSSKEALS